MFLGTWKIDDFLVITANTSKASDGSAYDASAITYRVYEDDTNTEIISDQNMTKFDSETGFYLNKIQLTAASGFEVGKNYTVLIKATVDSISATMTHSFQVYTAPPTASDIATAVWSSTATVLKKILAYCAGNGTRSSGVGTTEYVYKDTDGTTPVMTHTYDGTDRTVS